MVKLFGVALAAVATFVPLAAADNCQYGLNYCGYVLMRKGNYYAYIVDELENAGLPTDTEHIENTLFRCDGGEDGAISFMKECGSSCTDGGDNESDYC